MSSSVPPPQGFNGKWVVLIIVPLVLISFIWLAYNRINFKHPTSLMTSPATSTTAPAP